MSACSKIAGGGQLELTGTCSMIKNSDPLSMARNTLQKGFSRGRYLNQVCEQTKGAHSLDRVGSSSFFLPSPGPACAMKTTCTSLLGNAASALDLS